MKKSKALLFALTGILTLGTVGAIAAVANGDILSLRAQNGLGQDSLCSLTWNNLNKPTDQISQASTVKLAYGADIRLDGKNEHIGLKAGSLDSFVKTEGSAYANGVGGRLNGLTKIVIAAARGAVEDNVKLVLTVFNSSQPNQARNIDINFTQGSLDLNESVTVGTDNVGLIPDQFKLVAVNNDETNLNKIVSIKSINAFCTMAEDNATLNTYRFEGEDSAFTHTAKAHLCIGEGAMERNSKFSGGFALKWLKEGHKLSFSFKSDKDAIVNMNLRLSDFNHGKLLTQLYDININGNLYVNNTIKQNKGGDVVINGAYWTMNNTIFTAPIKAGDNTISFENKLGKNTPNFDYFEIKTSAKLDNTTVPTLYDLDRDVKFTKTPTFTVDGEFTVQCNTHTDNVKRYTLPKLNKKDYIVEETANGDTYYAPFGGNKVEINKTYTLTLDGAKFADESTSKKILAGEAITPVVNVPADKKLAGFVNANDANDVYTTTFSMPNKAITIKPVLVDKEAKYTLTLEDGTFENGATTASIKVGGTAVATPAVKEGKDFKGWVNKEDKSVIYKDLTTFSMPNRNVTLMAIYEAKSFANGVGKINTTPKKYDNSLPKQNSNIGVVGNEFGNIISAPIVSKNNCIGTQTAVDGKVTGIVTFTITLENFSDVELKLGVNKFDSYGTNFSIAASKQSGNRNTYQAITLAPGEVKTITLKLGEKYACNNGNTMTRITVLNETPVTNFKLGWFEYLSK